MEHTGSIEGKAARWLVGVAPARGKALVEGGDYSSLYDLDRITAEMDAFYGDAA